MVIESIITGAVVGIIVAAVGALVGYKLRRKEMRELWAEEERRRKSDRRRELYERELRILSDSVDAIMELMAATKRLTWLEERERVKWRFDLAEAAGLILKSHLVAISLRDDDLMDKCKKLLDDFTGWWTLLDWTTGKVREGKKEEFDELELETEWAASEVWHKIREMLGKV